MLLDLPILIMSVLSGFVCIFRLGLSQWAQVIVALVYIPIMSTALIVYSILFKINQTGRFL